MGILNEPIRRRLPRGYLFCRRCGAYEHHALIYCNRCGYKLERVYDFTWRNFIKRTARCGSGPLNTVRSLLGGWLREFPNEENKRQYEEARELYRMYGGWTGYTESKGEMTETTNLRNERIKPTHWLCMGCGWSKPHDKECNYGMQCIKCGDYLHPEGELIK